ncbi:lauroyl/myristoyl acyltransferase [Pseudoteredinibacter isoporae]|uniref:Lauroyl/myristoyl acyltransferase n=1 Tax=Pseudoteredinibacter isoporae TaxID=570281 RepID=A0A7X0MYE4_9GAMM|nr:lauroyl/myristoyl acyltransferase [Pseudoteredinibacter isoporae]
MNNRSELGCSDSLSDMQTAFGYLFLMLLVAFPEPLVAFGMASLATVMLASVKGAVSSLLPTN